MPIERPTSNRNWRLSEPAFHRLLEWLDEGTDSRGARYLEIRRRLAGYFDRKGCAPADDLADETLNRVARRLEEEGSIVGATPAQYCYIVARFVYLEALDKTKWGPVSLEALSVQRQTEALSSSGKPASELMEREIQERRHGCLKRCLQNLDERDRSLIFEYYHGEQRAKIENRQKLAARLGLSANALSIRTCRIRRELEMCIRQCMASVKGPDSALRVPE